MIFPDCSGSADTRQRQEEQPGYFQPEHMQYPAHVPDCDAARFVKGPDPAILAGLASRHS